MTSCKKENIGVTLFEMLLVLAIAASILIFSVGQYQTYRLDADIQEVKYNVDTIFAAMAAYHRANCYGSIDPAYANLNPFGQITPGALNPNNPNIASLSSPIPINIETDLVQKGFWPLPIAVATTESSEPPTSTPPLIPQNPLVDSTGPGYEGYVAQFNPYVETRVICTQPASAAPVVNPLDSSQCSATSTVGTILIWKIQVSILLGDPNIATDTALATNYLNLFQGDCLSSYDSGSQSVKPCEGSAAGHGGWSRVINVNNGGTTSATNYVVWERLPSLASPKAQSGSWISNATVQQFNQMYTTYPLLYLIAPDNNGNTPAGTPQYLYCGG